jgi:hypothetical protein
MNSIRIVLLALCLGSSASALAGGVAMPRSELREDRQELRIEHGIARGDIGPVEARHLQRGQRRVDHLQAAVRADGRVGPVERGAVHRLQDRQHRRIRRAAAY